MDRIPLQVLSDPWCPHLMMDDARYQIGFTALAAGTVVATNNDAHYIPIVFPCDATIYSMQFAAANGTGNYDIGLYDSALRRLVSSGSVAMSAAGIKTLAISDMRVFGGELYFAAGAWNNTAAQIIRPQFPLGILRGLGWGMEASAFPLPATATPTSAVAYAVSPLFAFGVR